jgi:hypothetical protein
MGPSISKATAEATINESLINSYAGTCDFQCNNKISNVYVDVVNTTIEGGLKIEQQCSSDGTCSINTSMDSLVDTVAKAAASSNAKDVGFLQGILDKSESDSRVTINSFLDQEVYDKCSIQSSNDMSNVNIFAVNSEIDGGILIGQVGTVTGSCSFQTTMKAVQKASGNANSTSVSGKQKCGECCGACSNIGVVAMYVGIGLLVVVVLGVAAYIVYRMTNKSPTTTTSSILGSKSNLVANIRGSGSGVATRTGASQSA